MISAVLLKDVDVRVRDVSTSGCLLESQARLAVGTVGMLDVEFEGQRRVEWFRVCRVQAGDGGGGAFFVGAEFLPFAAAGQQSLRGTVSRMRPAGQPGRLPGRAGRSSADPGNSADEVATGRLGRRQATGDSWRKSADRGQKVVDLSSRDPRAGHGNAVALGECTQDALGKRDYLKEKEKDI